MSSREKWDRRFLELATRRQAQIDNALRKAGINTDD